MDCYKVNVGSFEIEVSTDHIYLAPNLPPTYDYVPWNYIGYFINKSGLSNFTLIDIGANVGDSLAHYRRFSSSPVICVEPSDIFFALLERNAARFSNVQLVKALLVPRDMEGKVAFSAGHQTGTTYISEERDALWGGHCIMFNDLISNDQINYIVKSDTDGFDAEIINSLCEFMESNEFSVPLIFFEGPSEKQLKEDNFDKFVKIAEKLFAMKYKFIVFNNYGQPICFIDSIVSLKSLFYSLNNSMNFGMAPFHYFDIVAIKEQYLDNVLRLNTKFDKNLYIRD